MTKMTPQLRFQGFTDKWRTRKLGDIGKTYNGLSGKSGDDFGEGSKYIQYKQIFDSSRIQGEFGRVRIAPGEKQNQAQYGDIFFTTSSETPEETGYTSVLLDDIDGLYLNSFCFGYRADRDRLLPEFAQYIFHSEKVRAAIIRLAQGSTRYNISKTEVMKLTIALPEIEEQQKIAEFLTTVDGKISALEQKVEKLETYKRGVMQKIFARRIRFTRPDGSQYPEWETKKLGDIFEEVTRKVGNKVVETYSITAGKGFISQAEKFGRDISGAQNERYTLLHQGELSYNKGNSKTFAYGCVYANNTGKPIAVPNVFISFKPKNDNVIVGFYEQLFVNHYLDRHLRKIISSGARMDGLLNVNKKDFFDISVPMSSREEQQKIADLLSAIDQKITLTTQQLEKTKEFKKGLLQRMFV